MTARDFDTVVVGGGVAGLVMARDLAVGGRRVAVIEASDRLGGEVRRHTVAGIDLDAGAESFATRGGTVARLLTQLGLGDEIVAPDPRGAWVLEADGAAFPLPKTGLLGIPATAMAADVIEVIGQRAALRAEMDSLLPGTIGAKEQKLGPLVRRRMGQAVLDRLVTPVVMGVHSLHPDEVDVDRVAPGLRKALLRQNSLARAVRELRSLAPAGSQVSGIRGGMARLVDELVADLQLHGVELRLQTRAVAYDAESVTTDGGERLTAASVVIALGSRDSAELDGATPPTELITLATLVVDDPRLAEGPRGTGVLVAPGAPGVRAKALTHATAKWPWLAERSGGREVLRLSYDSPVVGRTTSDAELRAWAISDASTILGVALEQSAVAGFSRVEWDAPLRTGAAPAAARSVENAADAVVRIGGAASVRGLVGVIGDARRKAEQLLGTAEA